MPDWNQFFGPPEAPSVGPDPVSANPWGSYFDEIDRMLELRRKQLEEMRQEPVERGSFLGALGEAAADTAVAIPKAYMRGASSLVGGISRAGEVGVRALAERSEGQKREDLLGAADWLGRRADLQRDVRRNQFADDPEAPDSFWRDAGIGAVETVPQLGAVAVGGPVVGIGALSISAFGNEYEAAKAAGASDAQAALSAGITAVSEGVLEATFGKLPLIRQLKEAGARTWKEAITRAASSGGKNAAEELLQGLAQEAGQELTYSDDGIDWMGTLKQGMSGFLVGAGASIGGARGSERAADELAAREAPVARRLEAEIERGVDTDPVIDLSPRQDTTQIDLPPEAANAAEIVRAAEEAEQIAPPEPPAATGLEIVPEVVPPPSELEIEAPAAPDAFLEALSAETNIPVESLRVDESGKALARTKAGKWVPLAPGSVNAARERLEAPAEPAPPIEPEAPAASEEDAERTREALGEKYEGVRQFDEEVQPGEPGTLAPPGATRGFLETTGKYEYFERDGKVFKAPVDAPLDMDGYRNGARWEGSLEHWRGVQERRKSEEAQIVERRPREKKNEFEARRWKEWLNTGRVVRTVLEGQTREEGQLRGFPTVEQAQEYLHSVDGVAGVTAEIVDYQAEIAAKEQSTSAAQQSTPAPESAAPAVERGATATVAAPGMGNVGVQYAFVDVDGLSRASGELQPRNRERKAMKIQEQQIGAQLNPALLGASPTAETGRPIVNPEGVVLSGNGRLGGMLSARDNHPARWDSYQQFLRENAESFGLSPDQVTGNTALVAVLEGDSQTQRAFAKAANQPSIEGMGPVEQASSDAQAAPDRIFDLLEPDSDFNTAANAPFLREFFAAVSPGGINSFTTREGRVSTPGVNRAKAAVLSRAYSNSSEAVDAMFEDPESNVKRAADGMLRGAPAYIRALRGIESGEFFPLDISQDLNDALAKLRDLRERGIPVGEYLSGDQASLVEDTLSEEAKFLVRVLGSNRNQNTAPENQSQLAGSAKKLGQFIHRYAELVEAAGNPGQGTMFESMMAAVPTKMELLERAESDYEAAGATQEDLFGEAGPGLMEVASKGILDLRGPISWLFGNPRAPLSNPTPADLKMATDQVDARFQASDGQVTPGMYRRLANSVRNVWRRFRRTYEDLDPNKSPAHAKAADRLRRIYQAESYGAARAFGDVDQITEGMSPREFQVFRRLVILPDLLREIDNGTYDGGKELPFGYESRRQISEDLERFLGMTTPAVDKAIQLRQQIVNDVTNRLVQAGLLGRHVLEQPWYYHRQVMAYMNGNGRLHEGSRRVVPSKRGFQIKRVGGGDFNTNYHEAEFEWLADGYELLAKHRELQGLKQELDIAPLVRAQARAQGLENWKDAIPEGYIDWQPKPGNTFYKALTVVESALEELYEKAKENGDITQEDLDELEAREIVALGGRRETWVIPKDIADTLDSAGTPESPSPIGKPFRYLQTKWKQWTLLAPWRFLKYNLNNMSGDLDIALAADPKILKHVPRAFRIVWAHHIKRSVSPGLRKVVNELQRLAVMDSGWSLHDVEDLSKDGMLRTVSSTKAGVIARGAQRYWNNVRSFTTARENLLRIAAFYRAQELQSQGKEPTWASNAKQLAAAITDPAERAAKVSRELIGDYGNISQGGRWMRANMIPFYSWMEINAPRYVRLIRNQAAEGAGKGRTAAVVAATGARKVAFLSVKANILFGLAQLFNRTFGDEDEEMRRGKTRRDPYILLPNLEAMARGEWTARQEDGSIRTIRFEGALGDALEWLDLTDVLADVRDLRSGDKTMADMAAEAVKAPIERVAQSVRPDLSTGLVEIVGGRSMYPRLFEEGTSFDIGPRPVYDRAGAVASALSLTPVYEAVKQRPRRPGGLLRDLESRIQSIRQADGAPEAVKEIAALPPAMLFKMLQGATTYVTDPGEASYWDARHIVRGWLKERGEDTPFGFEKDAKGMALYYYKKAKRYGDEKAQRKFLQEYVNYGGTQKGMDQSVRRSSPLGQLSHTRPEPNVPSELEQFLAQLDQTEREIITQAEQWYSSVFGTQR